jgi:hypothetical protein
MRDGISVFRLEIWYSEGNAIRVLIAYELSDFVSLATVRR